MKTLVVIDMQNDFIDGALGTKEAVEIVPRVKQKILEYTERGDNVIFTKDTHFKENYLDTNEGKHLPIPHCIDGTEGYRFPAEIAEYEKGSLVICKQTFSANWSYLVGYVFKDYGFHFCDNSEIEFVGLCTDICVISNALVLKSVLPELEITVDASCCAGTSPEAHKAALLVMKQCQINVIGGTK